MNASLSTGRWYAIAVTPGREAKIRERILDRLERRSVTVPNLTLICPEEEEVVMNAKGERERKTRMSMPGYILAHCRALPEEAITHMTSVSGVLEFLGGNEKPTQLPRAEVDRILGTSAAGKSSEGRSGGSLFSVGDTVKIIEGPLADFNGAITELNEDAGTAKVEVEIFGRSTPAEVQLRQLRKA